MTEPLYDWRALRAWRVIGLVALVLVPLGPLAMVVLVELFEFPKSMHSVVGAPLLLVMVAAQKVTSFECPECRRSFSKHVGPERISRTSDARTAGWRSARSRSPLSR